MVKRNKSLGLPTNKDEGFCPFAQVDQSYGSAAPYTHTVADLVAWRQNLTERFGDLNAATRTARRTVLNSTFWAEQIRSMA